MYLCLLTERDRFDGLLATRMTIYAEISQFVLITFTGIYRKHMNCDFVSEINIYFIQNLHSNEKIFNFI